MTKISEWVSNAIDQILRTNNTVDVHVDDFIDTSSLSEADLVKSSIELFNLFVVSFKERKCDGLVIYLSLDFVDRGDSVFGPPKDFEELCREFDGFSMPEIILYKPNPLIYPPQVEIYRKPLFFKEFIGYADIMVFYKEDRPVVIGNEELDFRRELNIIYIP